MLDGILVLNIITHAVYGPGWSWLGFLAGLVCIISVLVLIRLFEKGEKSVLLELLAFLAIIMGVLCIVSFKYAQKVDSYETYEVIIDRSVSYLDFTEKFEVIGQRGRVYEIKPKNIAD